MSKKRSNVHKNTLKGDVHLFDGDILCETGRFTEIGRYTLSAGEALEPGYSELEGIDAAPGRIYIDLQTDVPADIDGDVRIMLYDERDYPLATVWQGRTEDLRLGAATRAARNSFPRTHQVIGPDQSLVVSLRPDAQNTVDETESDMLIDVTSSTVRGA